MPKNLLKGNGRLFAIALSAGVAFAGCSIQSFDYLSKGSGGKSSGGSAGKGDGGGGADTGGTTAQGGTAGSTTASGGSSGATTGAGGTAAGGSGGTTSTSTTTPSGTCSYVPSSGQLLKPPTTSFEVDIGAWSTTSVKTSALSIVQGDGHACDGSAYLTCNGTARSGAWDGPAVELLSYVKLGQAYTVSVAARYNQSTTLTAAKLLIMSTAAYCVDSAVEPVFSRVTQRGAYTNWVRFTSEIVIEMPGCTELSRFILYLETEEAEAKQSIDVDDFQILEVVQ